MFDFDVVTGSVPWIRKPDRDDAFDPKRKPASFPADIRSAGEKAAPEAGRPERR